MRVNGAGGIFGCIGTNTISTPKKVKVYLQSVPVRLFWRILSTTCEKNINCAVVTQNIGQDSCLAT